MIPDPQTKDEVLEQLEHLVGDYGAAYGLDRARLDYFTSVWLTCDDRSFNTWKEDFVNAGRMVSEISEPTLFDILDDGEGDML